MVDLGALFTRLKESKSVVAQTGYFAEYTIPTATLRTHDLQVPEGLVAWHVVNAPGVESCVITYWSSREAFLRDQKRWQAEIKGKLLSNHGWVGRIESYRPSWWTRIKPLHIVTIVLTLAGILAALETIERGFGRIFAEPAIALRHDVKRADVIEGDPLELKATVVNQIQTTHRGVEVKAKLKRRLAPDQKQKEPPTMIVSEASIRELTGYEKRDLTMTTPNAPAAGEYDAEIDLTAHAGWWRGAGNPKAVQFVKIWPLRPSGRVQAIAVSDTRGRLSGEIDVGPEATYGLDCEMQITGVASLRLMSFNTSAPQLDRTWNAANTPGQEVHVLNWSVPEFKAMRTIQFELILERDSPTKWDAVARATKLACSYRKRGIVK